MAAYATSSDLVARYNEQTIGGLASDQQGVRVPPANFATDPAIGAALKTASGKVKASIMQADRYTMDEIQGMSDPGSSLYDEESAEYLIDITCRVAFWLLWQRKPYSDGHENQRRQYETDSQTALDMLRKGIEIFNLGNARGAGLPEGVRSGDLPGSTGPPMYWSGVPRGRFYPRCR